MPEKTKKQEENTPLPLETEISEKKSDRPEKKSDSSEKKSDSSEKKSDSSEKKSDSSEKKADTVDAKSEENKKVETGKDNKALKSNNNAESNKDIKQSKKKDDKKDDRDDQRHKNKNFKHRDNKQRQHHKKKQSLKIEPEHIIEYNEPDRINISELYKTPIEVLYTLAESLNVQDAKTFRRNDLIYKILHAKTDDNGMIFTVGCLEVLPDGYGFLRVSNYLPSPEDVYISQIQIRRFGLLTGDTVSAQVRPPKDGERYFSLLRIESVNKQSPLGIKQRTHFSNLTPIYPDERFNLEIGPKPISTRIMDMMVPVGKGQRGLIVSPPKAGKTSIMKEIANAVTKNHPEVLIKVLLIDERPEEVTDMERSVNGEVIYSTFDEPPEQHVRVSELVLESAKRLVECGHDVLVLLDSITRLARAYNLVVPPSGRTLSGGLDPSSLHKPKRFFGGARNIENGGSLTIMSTALVDTGSRMDDIIYEEFKGTGNMELHLDRKLANRRIYPAIDILNSGTRKEDLLIDEKTLKKTYLLRKNIDSESSTDELIKLLGQTKNNEEFLNSPIFA